MKRPGKIHLLKAVTPLPEKRTDSLGQLVARLEGRLDRLEKELHHERAPAGPATAELGRLIRGLEDRLRQVTREMKMTRSLPDRSALAGLEGILRRLFAPFSREVRPDDSLDFDEFGMDPAFARRLKPLFNFFYYTYWRVQAVGIQNVPGAGRGLLVSNHSGTLPYDGAMIRLGVENEHPSRRDVRYLVEDFVYHFPFLGTLMYRIGGVRACPENAERLLLKDFLVVVFPEGVKGIGKNYRDRYHLQRFGRGGFIKLALKTGTPVIPVAVIGAEEIHPIIYKSTVLAKPLGIPYLPVTPTLPWLGPLGLVPLPSKWTIYFGEPFHFHKEHGPEAAEDQLLVNRLSEQVRCRIQEMVLEGLKQRRSVWFG